MNEQVKQSLRAKGYEVLPSSARPGQFQWCLKMERSGTAFPAIRRPEYFPSEDVAWSDAQKFQDNRTTENAGPGRSLDYTALVELSVTAESPEEAARFALDDLRDPDVASWTVKVTNWGDASQVDVAVEMETAREKGPIQNSIENVLGGLVAGMDGVTTEDALCADWRAIHGALVKAQDYVQKDGSRHTWLDGAIAIAKSRSDIPIPAAYLRRDASEAVESPVVSERPSGGG